jgi:hypothetical protein
MTDQTTTSAAPLPFPATWEITRLATILREHLPDLRERYQIRALGVFGSYVCNEQRPDSDLDVLVEFDDVPSLLTYVGIQIELSELLGVEVDIAHRSALKPTIGRYILQEVVWL